MFTIIRKFLLIRIQFFFAVDFAFGTEGGSIWGSFKILK